MLWAFSGCSGLYKVIKSPYFSLEKAQCKNDNLPWQHPPNGIFIRGLADNKRYTNIYTSKLRVSDQYQNILPAANIDFKISWDDSRFWGNDFELSQGVQKLLKVQNYCKKIPERDKVTVGELSKFIGEVFIHSNSSSSSTPPLLTSSKSTDSDINLSAIFWGERFWWWKGKNYYGGKKIWLCNRFLISPLPQIINSDASLQGWGSSWKCQTTGCPWSVEERKSHINVLELRAAKLAIIFFTLKERDEISVYICMDNMTALS